MPINCEKSMPNNYESISLTEGDFDEKLREMGNYLWILSRKPIVPVLKGLPALAEELETKILRQAERAQTFLQFAGRHQILAAFVAGLGFRMIRRWLEATDHFLRVVQLSPRNGEAWFPNTAASWGNLALALSRLGRTSEAKEAIQRAIHLEPTDPRNRTIEEQIFSSRSTGE
jgi:tetratricopeptide (TPR) repeat protein